MSVENVIDFLAGRLQEYGIKSGFNDPAERERVIRYLQGKSMESRYAYLTGYMDSQILVHLLLSKLRVAFPPKDSKDIILGFTGVPQQTHTLYGHCLGSAELNGNHSAFPLAVHQNLRNTVLHELGHVFGAEHIDNSTPSSMNPVQNDQGTLAFDNTNRERIIVGMASRQ
ncbi:MAG: hypothetical protein Q7K38_00655 [Candidatus Wildermuthbacteria bacterium]|nr:hypothetical protein [Candidatus Wildermuthbacteria bacterium]